MSKLKTGVTHDVARRVLHLVDHGLSRGLGVRKPGRMCVEAAVSFAYHEDHDDNPLCVYDPVKDFMIELNDSFEGTNKARAKFLRKLAIAQLGTARWSPAKKAAFDLQVSHIWEGRTMKDIATRLLQVLKKLRTPGTKYLYLVEGQAQRYAGFVKVHLALAEVAERLRWETPKKRKARKHSVIEERVPVMV